jgi:hypothetical protein
MLPAGQNLPGPAGNTIEFQYNDSGVLLGSEGTTGLPAGASTTYDESLTLLRLTALTDSGGDVLLPGGTKLSGMAGDLKLILHTSNSSATPINDITPSSPLTLHVGDFLYFGEASRNVLIGLSSTPSTDGGYLLLSDTSGMTTFGTGGNVTLNNPQNLSLNSGSFSVDATGTVSSGTPDNYNAGGVNGFNGNVVNTTPGSIVLAAKFVDLTTLPGFLVPGGINNPPTLPTGTLFIEEATGLGGTGSTNVTGLKTFGFLDAVGGNSLGNILNGQNFTPTNVIGSVPQNPSPAAGVGVTFAGSTSFAAANSNGYTQFVGNSNDPGNYIGALPADVRIKKTDNVGGVYDPNSNNTNGGTVVAGQDNTVVYTIVATNDGPNTAVSQTVTDATLTSIATSDVWTAVASAGSSVTKPSGTGNIGDTVTLLPNGTVTFTVTAVIHPPAGSTTPIVNTVTISLPNGDTTPGDNTSNDTITPTTTTTNFGGLTPGFWKNNADKWNASAWQFTAYTTTTTLGSVFNLGSNFSSISSVTFLAALNFSGGPTLLDAAETLIRQAVAALLDATYNFQGTTMNYPLTASQIISQVNAALASADRNVILTLEGILDTDNNLGFNIVQKTGKPGS